MPQVQHGSTVLLTAQRWKRAQLLYRVPKPRQKAQDVHWPWATHLAAAEAATFVPDTGLDYYFFGFQSSSFSQEKEQLGSWGLQPHILASDLFFTGKSLFGK